ncbi:hypothetical protein GTZ99_14405 [Novosphingobium sp. FSY-8]|uniref:Uncharacterized protein n=1 Tax=Novosphingobium ovatum TaxID=1908523 RepID=A0ABW9XH06_9SPHN|nr:hypothetical protein [Novosphingobium ovatum]NBC37744.1 hypothetical protein [Novosphingobium ovatum]
MAAIRAGMRHVFPLAGLRLLLPAIVPSWRFFDGVSASPRVEYALSHGADDPAPVWHPFRPRAAVVPWWRMLLRLFWNASWNEGLYLVSLAERLLQGADARTIDHSQRELFLRVARDLHRHGRIEGADHLRIRIRLKQRGQGEQVDSTLAYLSAAQPLAEWIVP